MSVDIKVNRIHKLDPQIRNIKAFADIEVGGAILVKGLQVLDGKNGLFVSMPRQKGKDNKWYETVRAMTPEVKDRVVSAVLEAYGI
jgi:stage V sporulation protein G